MTIIIDKKTSRWGESEVEERDDEPRRSDAWGARRQDRGR